MGEGAAPESRRRCASHRHDSDVAATRVNDGTRHLAQRGGGGRWRRGREGRRADAVASGAASSRASSASDGNQLPRWVHTQAAAGRDPP